MQKFFIINQLAVAFGKEISDVSLIQIFTTLLRDGENDVKMASVHSLSKFISFIHVDRVATLVPHIQSLMKDNSAGVRSATMEVLHSLFDIIQKDSSITKFQQPLVELLNDESYEVKMATLKPVAKYVILTNFENIGVFIPALKSLSIDMKWRARIEVLNCIIEIAINMKVFKLIYRIMKLSIKQLSLYILHISETEPIRSESVDTKILRYFLKKMNSLVFRY